MIKIKNLSEGTNHIYLLVKEVNDRTSKNGKTFVTFNFTDGSDTINANMWDRTAAKLPVKPGSVAALTLFGAPYNGRISYTVTDIREVNESDGVNISSFIKTSPVDPVKLFARCMEYIEREIEDSELSLLCKTIYEDNREQLLHSSAAKAVHHYAIGELLWHVTRMAATAIQVSAIYSLNKSAVVAGVLLHDIGKLKELDTDPVGNTTYTEEGSLFGHLMLGAEMVQSYGERLGISNEKIRMMRHIIVSHHGTREFGAIALPATAEAYAVHAIDLLDSRVYIYNAEAEKLAPGALSDRIGILDGVNVWKPDI